MGFLFFHLDELEMTGGNSRFCRFGGSGVMPLKRSSTVLAPDLEACVSGYYLAVPADSPIEDANYHDATASKAPETPSSSHQVTPMSDVCASGALLPELLTSKPPSQLPFLVPEDMVDWVRSARGHHDDGAGEENRQEMLREVVMAMRTEGGDQAVFQSLHRARELYLNRLQESTAADQLASLFAECAITEAQPLKDEQTRLNIGEQSPSAVPHVRVNSILAETGRGQLMLDAFSDGSSFICLKCGGLGAMPFGGVLVVSVSVGTVQKTKVLSKQPCIAADASLPIGPVMLTICLSLLVSGHCDEFNLGFQCIIQVCKPEENRPGVEDEKRKAGSIKSWHQPNHVICRKTIYSLHVSTRVK
ncbi:hypothetical protein SADUNF_Sadunf02G0104200 [Salix dunnii]|uniref:C2HC zinc finger plants domain-containing protein n=1 Tax=Salix dunnii TaxID=1413687 RepID=A0A835TGQ1_9ROSI|nr:hypothetical protein SADUNF_Sadunf02G0104200 [Salix dunnii]